MAKADKIEKKVVELHKQLIEKIPSHFSMRHIISAFIGALLFALTFVMKGLLFQIAVALTWREIVLIILSTWLILTGEIYFVGYARLSAKERKERYFGQFWLKRATTYYGIAIAVSALLIYIYGLEIFVGTKCNVLKLIIAVSMPAAIGASLADLVSKY